MTYNVKKPDVGNLDIPPLRATPAGGQNPSGLDGKVRQETPDGDWIRQWRARLNYSQAELAEELKVARQTVASWEKQGAIERSIHLALLALEMDPKLTLMVGRRETAGKRGGLKTDRGPP
uniref:Transcriptional regulator, XRE family n=1 Tax=Caulobacter sp. (strain K31) TaxID=366602 RepID=B0T9I1_CAUSK